MPRKKNRRKEIQKAKRAAQPKPKKRVGTIAHMPSFGSDRAAEMALAAMLPGLMMAAKINDKEPK